MAEPPMGSNTWTICKTIVVPRGRNRRYQYTLTFDKGDLAMTRKAVYQHAAPYLKDAMNLPVKSVNEALPFYENTMGFQRFEKTDSSVTLIRDEIRIGLAENGGDPTQEGCFFQVDDVEKAFEELKFNGLSIEANYRVDTHREHRFKVFFVVAPDGLCYCLGERLAD
jgi:lactoylglutathione lyase